MPLSNDEFYKRTVDSPSGDRKRDPATHSKQLQMGGLGDGVLLVEQKIRAYRSISVAKGIVRPFKVGVCDLGVLRYTHLQECVHTLVAKLADALLSKGRRKNT